MKHFLMVGASQGLGKVTQDLFEQNEIKTTVLSRSGKNEISVGTVRIDLSAPTEIRYLVREILENSGKISGACFFQRARPNPSSGVLENEIDVSIQSTKAIVEEAMTFLDDGCDHSFLFTSSVNSTRISPSAGLDYHIVKAGLDITAKYYAEQFGRLGVRFNTVNPGSFIKPNHSGYYCNEGVKYADLVSCSPLKRATKALDVAELIFFLSSPKASAITGQNITIDSGASLKWPEA